MELPLFLPSLSLFPRRKELFQFFPTVPHSKRARNIARFPFGFVYAVFSLSYTVFSGRPSAVGEMVGPETSRPSVGPHLEIVGRERLPVGNPGLGIGWAGSEQLQTLSAFA